MRIFPALFLSFFFCFCSSWAQQDSSPYLNLGFSAKMNHLSNLKNTEKQAEDPEVKKSTRSLAEILAKGNAKNKTLNYHLIAGCFSSESNANKYVTKLQQESYEASVVGAEDDLYFVAYKTFKVYEEAIACLAKFKAEGIDAWVKKM